MRRKILSVVLVLAMTISLFAGITVNAASPITYTGTETVLFDYYFGDLTSVADAKDLDITGKWEFTPYFMSCTSIGSTASESVTTKESYNFTDESGFIFETKFEIVQNSTDISLPGEYKVTYTHSGDGSYITLSKGGEVVAQSDRSMYLWSYDTKYTIKYLSGKWTINIDNVEQGISAKIEYEDESNPELAGKFGVTANNAYYDKFTMYSMKLTKIGGATTVNNWKYEHTFNADDTVESLEKEGITFSAAPVSFSDNFVTLPSTCAVSFVAPQDSDEKMFTGDYVLKTKFYRHQQYGVVRFNKNGSSWYDISLTNTADVQLRKIEKNGNAVKILDTKTYKSGITWTYKRTYDIDIKVYNSDASTRIVANVHCTDANETLTFDYTDTGSPITSGNVEIVSQYGGNQSAIYYVNMYSLMSEDEMAADKPVQYAKTVIDKTFSSADTVASLAAEGITTGGSTPELKDNYLTWTASASNSLYYTNSTDLKGSYSFKAKLYRPNGSITIKFSEDGSNRYEFYAYNTDWKFSKVYNGTTFVLDKANFSNSTHSGYGRDADVNIKVTKQSDGSVKIDIVFEAGGNTTKTSYVDSMNDMIDADGDGEKETTTGAPITGGTKISLVHSYFVPKVYSIGLTTYADSWEENVIDKTFSSADTRTSLANEGITFSAAPTSIDDTGARFDYSSSDPSVVGTLTYTNPTAFNGSYSIKAKTTKDNANTSLRFSHDGTNYYTLYAGNGGPNGESYGVKLTKNYNGTTYVLAHYATDYTGSGRGGIGEMVVNLTKQDDGSILIDANWSLGTVKNITYVDSADDKGFDGLNNGAPIKSGSKLEIQIGYARAIRFITLNVTKHNTSKWFDANTGELIYTGRFFDGAGNGLSQLKNGSVYFDYPVARLGTYKVIATLIENHEMTDIKVLNPIDLYAGNVRLFTVTDADNAKVKVFFVDGEETLNNIAEVYELN